MKGSRTIAGGHTIDSVEPIYGLAAIGLVDPREMKRNLGALKKGALDMEGYALLTDPQTSGGLLVACTPDAAEQVLECFRSHGLASASIIGHVESDTAPVLRLAVTGGAA